jgi:hypothetical protein
MFHFFKNYSLEGSGPAAIDWQEVSLSTPFLLEDTSSIWSNKFTIFF